jgi:uncharacterized membrane protein
MKDARHVRWLSRELPELVAQGVIPSEAAEQIRQHYGQAQVAASAAKHWAVVLFGILGAVLIGGGIILLLAHNWEELSRPMRAAISVAPLVFAAALGSWLLWTERDSTAWREGVGTAQTLALGSSIALVSQTYNLGGRLDEFMLTWSLLALPIAYLLRATLPALLYLVGIVVWAVSVTNQAGGNFWYYPLLTAVLPFIWWTSRKNRYHPRPVLLLWVLAVTIGFGTGFASEPVCTRLDAWPVLFGGLFAVLYMVGARWWGEASSFWQRPLQNVGALGAVGLALALSFGDIWSHVSWHAHWEGLHSFRAGLLLASVAAFPAAALVLWVHGWIRQAWSEVLLGGVALLALVAWFAATNHTGAINAVLFNLYLLILGTGTLAIGFRCRRLGAVNAGMAVLSATILCRFFDSDLSFVVRGMAFILIGSGFLMTNLMLLRRKGAVI